MDEQSLLVRQGGHTTNRITQQMNSNRSSNQGQGKAKGKNRPARKQKQRKAQPASSNLEKAPLAQGRQRRSSPPSMTQSTSRPGSIRVRHREYIQDVNGSVAFTATTLPVQPGMATGFPWLSTLAQNFESYRFHALKYVYETQKSASTNGTVLLGVDFDATDSAPTTKQQLMSYEGAVRSGVWQECHYVAKPSSLHKFGPEKFNRFAALAANQDIKTYDAGNLFVATQGCADATAIGELYVEYDVELHTPQIQASGSTSASARVTGTTGLSTTVLFGTNAVVDADSTLSISVNGAGTTVTFNSAFEGIASCNCVGATCNTIAAGAGTATAVVQGTNSAGTNGLAVVYITATAGQTFAPTCSGFGTPVSAAWWFTSMAANIKA